MGEKLLKYWGIIVALATYLIGLIIWITTMNGIPPRVSSLEQDVKEISTQVIKNDSKIDVILEDTKFMKQIMMHKYTK